VGGTYLFRFREDDLSLSLRIFRIGTIARDETRGAAREAQLRVRGRPHPAEGTPDPARATCPFGCSVGEDHIPIPKVSSFCSDSWRATWEGSRAGPRPPRPGTEGRPPPVERCPERDPSRPAPRPPSRAVQPPERWPLRLPAGRPSGRGWA